MLSKEARLAYLIASARRLKLRLVTTVPGLMTVSRVEILAASSRIVSPIAEEMNDETRDESETGNVSRLSFDKTKSHASESDFILSRAERERLREDARNYRIARDSFELPAHMEFA